MNNSKELIKLDDPKNVIEFLQQPAIKMGEFITGLLVSDTKDYKLSAGHLVQASIKYKLYSQLGKEIKSYIEKGKIKEDFLNKDLNKQALSDLLKFIDETSPGEDQFNAMKTLFLNSVSNDSKQEIQILSYQFMKICRKLESSDLLILKAAYDIKYHRFNKKLITTGVNHKTLLSNKDANSWLKTISDQIGHGISSLIEVQEEKLISLKLIGSRTHSDGSGIQANGNYRLTELGCRICDFIYEK